MHSWSSPYKPALRVSELIGLNCGDLQFGTASHVRCFGKGRKERATPLTASTAATLRVWLAERAGAADEPLFPTRTGRRLSRDAVQQRIAKHCATAEERCPSLRGKHLSPHVLRHTAAMQLLHAGVDTSVIALWLGHEDIRSTQIYLHADLTLKERALARTSPGSVSPADTAPRIDSWLSSRDCNYADGRNYSACPASSKQSRNAHTSA